jgi:hypothetical protein
MAAERSRSFGEKLLGWVIPFLIGIVGQGALYASTVQQDIHDLKRDMADLKCTVAIYTRSPLLPPNCVPGRYGDNGQWKEQKSQ